MARPAVSATTEALYAAIPERIRLEDELQDPDWPLLRYLSLIGDQLDEVVVLIDRVDYVTVNDGGAVGDTSDLADPATADVGWLDWLGQLVGVRLAPALTEAERRDAVAFSSSGWRAATKGAVADAARSALTGTRYVHILDHYAGDPWRVEVRTRTSETPSVPAVLEAIVAKGAKPAGVELVPTAYDATWAQLEALRPTWADWEAAGSWALLEETGA